MLNSLLKSKKRRFKQSLQQTLTKSGGTANSWLGHSVAISNDGNTLIAGGLSESFGSNFQQGGATVFVRSGSTWSQQQALVKSDGAGGDQFGEKVAISRDGNTVIIGARYDGVGSNSQQGSATVFTRSGTTWTQQQILTQAGATAGDRFGYAVALSGDGNTAIVTCQNDTITQSAQGSAVVFTRSGTTWTEQQTLVHPSAAASDFFGYAVAISDDGNTAIITCPARDVGSNTNQGSAAVFIRSGGTWAHQQTLTHSTGAANDSFGISVALSTNGNIAFIGVQNADIGANSDQGSVVIFTRSGTTWTQKQVITQSNGGAGDFFGISIGLSGNGNIAAIGVPFYGSTNTGLVTIFTGSGDVWTERDSEVLTLNNPVAGDWFGRAVSLSNDGNILAVGCPLDDIGANSDQGSVTIFYRK
jgi:hypothetical protein